MLKGAIKTRRIGQRRYKNLNLRGFGMKKAYTKPTVDKVGTFESVTQSTGSGGTTDFNFQAVANGAPFTPNVFS